MQSLKKGLMREFQREKYELKCTNLAEKQIMGMHDDSKK